MQIAAACLVDLLLAFAAAAAAQQAPAGQKVIHDPAEYNAYTAAVNTQDANKRAEELEAFVQQYPQSVVLTDALEQELAAWQTAGDSSQMKRVAKRLLAADPGNVRVLGIVVALDRVSAAQGDLASLNEMCVEATGGMREVPMWRKPADMTDADFAALSKLMNDIFIGAEGFCAVQEKNYSEARDWLARALQIDPSQRAGRVRACDCGPGNNAARRQRLLVLRQSDSSCPERGHSAGCERHGELLQDEIQTIPRRRRRLGCGNDGLGRRRTLPLRISPSGSSPRQRHKNKFTRECSTTRRALPTAAPKGHRTPCVSGRPKALSAPGRR